MDDKKKSKTFELVLQEKLKNGQPTGKVLTVETDRAEDLWGFLYKHTPANMRDTLSKSFLSND